jgi:hypothetical protein
MIMLTKIDSFRLLLDDDRGLGAEGTSNGARVEGKYKPERTGRQGEGHSDRGRAEGPSGEAGACRVESRIRSGLKCDRGNRAVLARCRCPAVGRDNQQAITVIELWLQFEHSARE